MLSDELMLHVTKVGAYRDIGSRGNSRAANISECQLKYGEEMPRTHIHEEMVHP